MSAVVVREEAAFKLTATPTTQTFAESSAEPAALEVYIGSFFLSTPTRFSLLSQLGWHSNSVSGESSLEDEGDSSFVV